MLIVLYDVGLRYITTYFTIILLNLSVNSEQLNFHGFRRASACSTSSYINIMAILKLF